MKLSELIIRRKIRRILQEAVPTSTAVAGTFGYAANPRGGSGSFNKKITYAVLGAIGARILYGILNGAMNPQKQSKLSMNAVICGDSQGAGPIGGEVKKILESKGYTVKNVSVDGSNPSQVLTQVKSNAENAILVVAIFGGNTTDTDAPARATTEMYDFCEGKGTAFMAIGSPPVTRIQDYSKFAGSFSARAKDASGNVDYWLNLPDNDSYSPEGRKELSDKMEAAKGSKGEDIRVYGIASNWTAGTGGNYPDQPDGLHCYNGADKVARAAMDGLEIDAVTQELRNLLGTKQYDADEIGRVGKPGEISKSNFNVEQYKRGIHGPESSGGGDPYKALNKPNPPNYSGAYGKYQFLVSANTKSLVDFLDSNQRYSIYSSGKYKDLTGRDWNDPKKKSLVYELWSGFLKDPDLQEKFMDQFAEGTKTSILDIYGRTRNKPESVLSKLDLAQLCALAHLGGKGGLETVERENNLNISPGGNNLTYAVYLDRFNKFFY